MNFYKWLPHLISRDQNAIIDLLPNYFVFWKDKNSAYLGCNKAFAQYFGFASPADIIGKTDFDLPVSKEECHKYVNDDRHVMESKQEKLNIEETQTLLDGTRKILLTSKIPLLDDNNKVYGILGIYSDITEQKLREQTLHLRSDIDKQLQKSIIDHLPNHFIFWKDKNSVFLGCNQTFATGAHLNSPADVIGKTDYDLPWSKEESDRYILDDQQVMASKQPKLNIEEPQTLPNGKKIILSTSKMPLFDTDGDVCGILAIYSDITEQKLNEIKLLEANKKLEKSHQAKSEFIRNISHDIRTPLSGIQQTVRAISDGRIPEEEIPEFAFAAWEASNKLMNLFNQIIDVSKNEHFDFEDQIVKFDLYDLLENLNETYKVVAKHKHLVFEIEYSDSMPRYLLGKHLRLHRILMNLVGNALKFTEKGSVRLVVEEAQHADDKCVVRFSIIDTGIGIPVEKQDVIFEPFTRLTPSFQGQYPGSGLGLHVVKEYVEKMQGEIYVESAPGEGAMFTCILPFKRSILDNDNDVVENTYAIEKVSIADLMPAPKFTPTFIRHAAKFHLLLVEDDQLAQSMGALILRDMGYQVDVAQSSAAAIELAKQISYDLIYMDVGLPDIDGIETTRHILADKNSPCKNAFIVALTAHADDMITKQCHDAGMQQLLLKPLSPEKAQQIHRLLIQAKDAEQITPLHMAIDYDLWCSRLGNNSYMLDELFHILVKDFPVTKQTIMDAYAQRDFPTLKKVTHKMKGGLQYCGLPRLEAAIKAIETAAKNKDEAEVNRWYQETIDALDEAMQVYEEWKITHPKL